MLQLCAVIPGQHRLKNCRRLLLLAATLLTLTLSGCSSTIVSVEQGPLLDATDRWALLPFSNLTDAPLAADGVESILGTLLRVRGVQTLTHYPSLGNSDAALLLDEQQRYQRSLDWARGAKFHYAISGTVDEWHYRSGVEREPAVGISLRVVELPTGKVIWSSTGARSGWGRESVSGTAQKLLMKMLSSLRLREESRKYR